MDGLGAKDSNAQRLLNLSKQFNEKKKIKERDERRSLYDYASDGSSYYQSSDQDLDDIERNKYKDSEDEDDDEFIAEPGVGSNIGAHRREITMVRTRRMMISKNRKADKNKN